MDSEYEQLLRRPMYMRLLSKRSAMLDDFLKEHDLAEPKSIKYAPLRSAVPLSCFPNVEAHVQRAGGRLESGWLFREYKETSLATLAHAIWVTPGNVRWDITPQSTHDESRILFLPDARVAEKRGITAGYKTILSQDPRVRLMEQYAAVVDRAFEEHWAGPGEEIVLPIEKLKAAGAASGLPDSVAYHIYRSKRENFTRPMP